MENLLFLSKESLTESEYNILTSNFSSLKITQVWGSFSIKKRFKATVPYKEYTAHQVLFGSQPPLSELVLAYDVVVVGKNVSLDVIQALSKSNKIILTFKDNELHQVQGVEIITKSI